MGFFSNAVFSFKELPSGVIHIIDEGVEEISVTNDQNELILFVASVSDPS